MLSGYRHSFLQRRTREGVSLQRDGCHRCDSPRFARDRQKGQMTERPDAVKLLALLTERPDAVKLLALLNTERPDAVKLLALLMTERPDAVKLLSITERPDAVKLLLLMTERPDDVNCKAIVVDDR